MQFIVRYFPEITIKSKPVRKQFVKQLRDNLRKLLKAVDSTVSVESDWDKIVIKSDVEDAQQYLQMVEVLSCTPGIANFQDVMEYPFVDMHQAYEKTRDLWGDRLAGKTFAVRCKRFGAHDFTSHQLEQYIGGGLNQHCESAGVDLRNADITVRLEVNDKRLYLALIHI